LHRVGRHAVAAVGGKLRHRAVIVKILIECSCFKFSENMSPIRLENGQKYHLGKNRVFNGLC